MVNQNKETVSHHLRQIHSEEHEAVTVEAVRLTIHVAQLEQQRDQEFKTLMNEKLAQIQQLQVYLLNPLKIFRKQKKSFTSCIDRSHQTTQRAISFCFFS